MLFIKKVYHYSKPLAVGMLFFVLVQMVCFYKGGMIFSPWYNYGMYSSVINIEPSYSVNKIANLQPNQFSAQGWDKIHFTLIQMQSLDKSDSLYENEVKRIFTRMHLLFSGKEKFVNAATVLEEWYKTYVMKQLPKQQQDVKIQTNTYYWNGSILDTVPTHNTP